MTTIPFYFGSDPEQAYQFAKKYNSICIYLVHNDRYNEYKLCSIYKYTDWIKTDNVINCNHPACLGESNEYSHNYCVGRINYIQPYSTSFKIDNNRHIAIHEVYTQYMISYGIHFTHIWKIVCLIFPALRDHLLPELILHIIDILRSMLFYVDTSYTITCKSIH